LLTCCFEINQLEDVKTLVQLTCELIDIMNDWDVIVLAVCRADSIHWS
ncbi:hypothetical protein NPIL_17371, partial [Nephila pilipes]